MTKEQLKLGSTPFRFGLFRALCHVSMFYPGGPAKFWQNVAKGCNASMRRKKILAKFQSDGCKASKLESVCVKRRIQQLSAARKS